MAKNSEKNFAKKIQFLAGSAFRNSPIVEELYKKLAKGAKHQNSAIRALFFLIKQAGKVTACVS